MATIEQCILPTEIVCRILRYSGPRDVAHWRTVSKWFEAITYDRSIWRDLYKSSYLPRPPGPFSFQSTAYLEQALVGTEKLARSWTSKTIRDVAAVKLQVRQTEPITLLGGRWFIEQESDRRLILHDVDASGEKCALQKQVLWEQDEKLVRWDAVLTTTEDRGTVLYVVSSNECEPDVATRYISRLVEFHLDTKSGKLSVVTVCDVPPPSYGFSMRLKGGNHTPFLYIHFADLVFDTRTRVFCEFPKIRVELDETRRFAKISADPILMRRVVLTDTYIIAAYQYSSSASLIQAFIIDESSIKDGKGVLRVTHEGISTNSHNDPALLRNCIVDPVTGATNVRLFRDDYDSDIFKFFHCVHKLTFPKAYGEEVLPITVDIDEKITKKLREHAFYGKLQVDFSDAGYLRGLFIESEGPYDCSFMKFIIDATQDECTFTWMESIIPEWNHISFTDLSYESGMAFDGATGRLCFVEPRVGDEEQVVVVSLE